MFCPKCGSELPNGAKFCAKCGNAVAPQTPVAPPQPDRQAQWNAQWESPTPAPAPAPAPTPKKKPKAPVWQIALVIVGVIVALSLVGKLISSLREGSSDGRDTILNTPLGNINIPANPDEEDEDNFDDDYTAAPDIADYKWVEDHYFLYYPSANGNEKWIIKFSNLTETSIDMDYYTTDSSGMGGQSFSHETMTQALSYDAEDECYAFYGADGFRLYRGKLMYCNDYKIVNSSSVPKYTTAEIVIPEEYDWYNMIKIETGDYIPSTVTDISQAEIGDWILFGTYEMDGDTSNGWEPITWQVIDENDNGIFVISRFCLEHISDGNNYGTWETCTARQWLNNDFYNAAFTPEEQGKILITYVVNEDNRQDGTSGGNDTFDKLYLLSISEKDAYGVADRITQFTYPTRYLRECMGAEAYKTFDYRFGFWLRTPEEVAGSITQSYSSMAVAATAIRPVMWIAR